ncbi:hypothetical protein NI17_002730 [Thermobifida halotolerans]|uniref:Uncharacterized protein n=1 Tax=Thermobifida halotolerans TaxID=483545 RepID=A0A399G824_9ACTN|nr:hypothetical protein [Thermobifida halotolerans]UOE20181.1 hypothetical protein NI17_002730 [Thermobifida halotolerans]
MDDTITIEALEIPGDVAEAALRKARAAHMSLRDYLVGLLEADIVHPVPSAPRDLLAEGGLPAPVTDELVTDTAEFRDSVKGNVTTEDILAALHEGRPE